MEEEEGGEEDDDGNGNGNGNGNGALSTERGTASTEPNGTTESNDVTTSRPTRPQKRVQFPAMEMNNNNNPPQQQQKQQQAKPNQRKGNVQIQINGRHIPQLDMLFSAKRSTLASSFSLGGKGYGSASGSGSNNTGSSSDGNEPNCRFVIGNGLRPSTETLRSLVVETEVETAGGAETTTATTTATTTGGAILRFGRNLLRYNLHSKNGIVVATSEAHLYLWKSCDSVVVSDVDGTVTKSDVMGVIDTVVQDKFEYCHAGICKFYNQIANGTNDIDDDDDDDDDDCNEENAGELLADGTATTIGHRKNIPRYHSNRNRGQIRFMYLSSRPIRLVNQTRKLLLSLSQTSPPSSSSSSSSSSSTKNNEKYGLPPGPIMCHTGPLSSVLYSELWAKNIYEFKADVLARQIVLPFVAARGEDWNDGRLPSSTRTVLEGDDDMFRDGGRENDGNDEGRRTWSGMSEASSVRDDRLLIAGFGNKGTDAMAYEMAGVDRRDIYIIDKESRILCTGASDGDDDINNNNNNNNEVSSSMEDVGGGGTDRLSSLGQRGSSAAPASSSVNCGGGDTSEWLREACCSPEEDGGGGGRTLSDSSAEAPPVRMDSAASSSDANKAASTIHSVELSLSDEGEQQQQQQQQKQPDLSESLSKSLTLPKTDVDIFTATNNDGKQKQTSSWAVAKQGQKKSKLKRRTIRAFSSSVKKGVQRFPSFSSSVSSSSSSSSRKKVIFEGYSDPLLLMRIRERITG